MKCEGGKPGISKVIKREFCIRCPATYRQDNTWGSIKENFQNPIKQFFSLYA
jgi:hypothetical protein